jgi:hypothetical protein
VAGLVMTHEPIPSRSYTNGLDEPTPCLLNDGDLPNPYVGSLRMNVRLSVVMSITCAASGTGISVWSAPAPDHRHRENDHSSFQTTDRIDSLNKDDAFEPTMMAFSA